MLNINIGFYSLSECYDLNLTLLFKTRDACLGGFKYARKGGLDEKEGAVTVATLMQGEWSMKVNVRRGIDL
jgi:hypothetical protein